jgi:hypothetical protein
MRIRFPFVIAALAGSQLGATDCGNVIKDPGFDLWCDGQLCSWTVERGSVAQVPTWNAADFGVEFDGSDVAISQISPVASSDGSCIEFDLIADVDDNAEVDLNFDAFADGTIDFSQRIPTSNWAPLSFLVSVGGEWSGMRFEIAKHGNGHAVVAQVAAKIADPGACDGFTGFTAGPAPLGASCSPAEQCGSGEMCEQSPELAIIYGNVCMGCVVGSDASCGSGDVCGLGDPISPVLDVPVECVPASARPLGAPCIGDGECETGICTDDACSTCHDDLDCGSDQHCGPGWFGATGLEESPYVCAPGEAMAASGAPCAGSGDCRTGVCVPTATAMECSDGRLCKTNADCPFDGGDGDTVFDNGPCTAVGILGGTCQ